MAASSRKLAFVNVLGTLGYMSILFQWLWAIVIIANPILSSDFSFFIPSTPVPPEPTPPISTAPSPIVIIVVIALTVVVFAATLYILWRLPKSLGLGVGKATKKTADALTPLLPHHHPITKKRRRVLSRRIVLVIKWTIIVIPLLTLFASHDIGPMTKTVILWVGIFGATCSTIYIGIQLLLARMWNLPREDVW